MGCSSGGISCILMNLYIVLYCIAHINLYSASHSISQTEVLCMCFVLMFAYA